MSDLLPSHPRQDGAPVSLVNPTTGEVLDLGAPAHVLADAIDDLGKLAEEVAAIRKLVTGELALRLDERAARTATIDGVKLKVNAPTEDHYNKPEDLERDLRDAGYDALADELITRPAPVRPPVKVDKRVVNRALKGEDRQLLAILARHRTRVSTARKVDVVSRAVEATAEPIEQD